MRSLFALGITCDVLQWCCAGLVWYGQLVEDLHRSYVQELCPCGGCCPPLYSYIRVALLLQYLMLALGFATALAGALHGSPAVYLVGYGMELCTGCWDRLAEGTCVRPYLSLVLQHYMLVLWGGGTCI
jgi:hypothetical protein